MALPLKIEKKRRVVRINELVKRPGGTQENQMILEVVGSESILVCVCDRSSVLGFRQATPNFDNFTYENKASHRKQRHSLSCVC
jgi:hypothetical protein